MIAIGSVISHFEIIEPLGQGGMGIVYKARDRRLDRLVAIKVLSSSATSDDDRRRLIHEARSASALQHPNIATVYEVDEVGADTFIAMEYVEGSTLHDHMRRHRLSVTEVLNYGIQIADALSAAHRIGIVHRDVKPANILVTEAGTVKVVDFGIAKLTGAGAKNNGAGLAATVTIAAPQTDEGMIVGTVAYMSPEQAEGKKIDERSDIFSVGILLYEMLTARHPFPGDTNLSTLAAILVSRPKPLTDYPGVPADLAKIVMRTLRKDPSRRFQVIADLKLALEDVIDDLQTGDSPVAAARPTSRHRIALAALAVIAVTSCGTAGWLAWHNQSRSPLPLARFTRLTSDLGLTTDAAISPDGKLVAYASDRSGRGDLDIWVQQIAGGAPVRLTTDEANERQPSFSHDGASIVFRSERENGGIYVIPALGGAPTRVSSAGFNPKFSPDGRHIAYWTGAQVTASTPSKIFVVMSTGGAAEEVRTGLQFSRHPVWSPDGTRLLFWGTTDGFEGLDWYTVAAIGNNSGTSARTGMRESLAGMVQGQATRVLPQSWSGDRVTFAASTGDTTDLWSVRVSPTKWGVEGQPERITSGLDSAVTPGRSNNDRLVWAKVETEVNIWMLPADTSAGKITGEMQQVTRGLAPQWRPYLSRDGRRLVFNRGPGVVLKDLQAGTETVLTSLTGMHPSLSADGTKVAYARPLENRPGSTNLGQGMEVWVDSLNGEVPEKVCDSCGMPPAGWSTDQKRLLFDWGAPQGLGVFDFTKRANTMLLQQQGRAFSQGSFSPDDKWILFLAGSGPGRQRVYVMRDPGNSAAPDERDWIAITNGTNLDSHPRWSPDGKLIYLLSDRDGNRCLWARRVDEHTKRSVGELFAVHHFHNAARSLGNISGIGVMGLGVARDRIAVNLGTSTGNFWMADLRGHDAASSTR